MRRATSAGAGRTTVPAAGGTQAPRVALVSIAERHSTIFTLFEQDFGSSRRHDLQPQNGPYGPRTTFISDPQSQILAGAKDCWSLASTSVRTSLAPSAERTRAHSSVVHEAALAAHGHTVAVLANGLDSVYPKQNAALAARILDNGGAWLSEQPFGTPAIGRNLVHRDRLQSGMSITTIVMQTDVVGGSMHTVRYTLMQGRLLVAPVPPGAHAEEPKSRGIVALTQKTGADLSRLVEAQGAYAELLTQRYARRPVAIPLAGRDEYGQFLNLLESMLAEGSGTTWTTTVQSAPQLGLSLN